MIEEVPKTDRLPLVADDRFADRAGSPIITVSKRRWWAAAAVAIIGFPTAIWFNHLILPTDDPGPIGLGAVLFIIILLSPRDPTPHR